MHEKVCTLILDKFSSQNDCVLNFIVWEPTSLLELVLHRWYPMFENWDFCCQLGHSGEFNLCCIQNNAVTSQKSQVVDKV